MRIEKIEINKLKPAKYNPRQITKKQYNDLKDSLDKFSLVEPIVVNKDMTIIGGHQRYKIWKENAEQSNVDDITIPCVVLDLNKEQERELNIRLNKSGGQWDMDILANEFDIQELKEWGFKDIEFGFNIDKITEGNTEDDHIPEVKESRVKLGDVWQLGNHRLMCGDSTKESDVKKLMNGQKADMVFTDPPYGINMSRSLVSGKDNSIKNDNIKGLDVLLNKSLKNAFNFSKENINCYLWIGFRAYNLAESIFNKYWKTSNCIIWNKPSIGLGGKGYRYKHELCIFSGNIEDKSLADVWEFNRDASGLHPTMKPVELVVKAINDSIKIKNIVIDLFLGSGSTLIACEKTNRICYGMELDTKYCDVIIERWEQFTGQKATKL